MKARRWTFEDIPLIARLEEESFSDPWNRRMLADSFLSPNFCGYLLEEGGQITAYGGIEMIPDEAELLLIATAEMYRRCGRAQEVLNTLFAEAKKNGVTKMFLEVRVSNAAAQMLYLKNGFVGVYVRPRYYADGEDAIVMKKEF